MIKKLFLLPYLFLFLFGLFLFTKYNDLKIILSSGKTAKISFVDKIIATSTFENNTPLATTTTYLTPTTNDSNATIYTSSTEYKILVSSRVSGMYGGEGAGEDYLILLNSDSTFIYKIITGWLGGAEKQIYRGKYIVDKDKLVLNLDGSHVTITSDEAEDPHYTTNTVSTSTEKESQKILIWNDKLGGYLDESGLDLLNDPNYTVNVQSHDFMTKEDRKNDVDYIKNNIFPNKKGFESIGYFVFVDKYTEY